MPSFDTPALEHPATPTPPRGWMLFARGERVLCPHHHPIAVTHTLPGSHLICRCEWRPPAPDVTLAGTAHVAPRTGRSCGTWLWICCHADQSHLSVCVTLAEARVIRDQRLGLREVRSYLGLEYFTRELVA